MVTQQTRDKVADWLQFVIDRVGEITEGGNPEKFQMGRYVTEWDSEHNCATCCCIEGWLPVIFPKQLAWVGRGSSPIIITSDESFYPERIGIPLQMRAWNDLTLGGPPEFAVKSYINAPYSEVKEIWIKYINAIRAGELDQKLIDTE